MPRIASSTVLAGPRQWFALAAAALLLAPAGCAGPARPLHGLAGGKTAALRSVGAAGGAQSAVDPSDWEAVRARLAELFGTADPAASVAWENPSTGSNGILSQLLATAAKGGASCRTFAATMSDLRGVRTYRGEACPANGGTWTLTEIVPEDATLT